MRFETELSYAEKELSRIRAELAFADMAFHSPNSGVRDRAASTRAATYVWLGALLERTVKDVLRSTLTEISGFCIAHRDLKLSLFSLAFDSNFDAISDRNKSNAWPLKVELLAKTAEPTAAVFPGEASPLDGRTIRGEHFDTIWLVLGLMTATLPSPLHRVALRDLADGRNEVAHGHTDPIAFGRAKAVSDIQRLSSRVDEVIVYLMAQLDRYVDGRLFLR